MPELTAAERAERQKAARREHKALVAWERNGQQGDRPDTTNYDAINAQYVAGGVRKTRVKGGPRKPRVCPIDGDIRDAYVDGRIAHPMSVTEIARVVGAKASSTYHGVQRLLAAGELVETAGRPAVYWLTAAPTKPAARPEAPKPEPKAKRTYTAKTKTGTVHTCQRRKIDGAFVLVPVCVKPDGKLPAVERTDDESTCKNCAKVAA